MKQQKLITLLALGALAATSGTAQTLLDHTFTDVRNNQSLPTSSAWYKGGGSAVSLDAAPGSLSFSTTGSSHLVGTNFVDSTAGYTLQVGEVLTMRYTFSADTVASGNSFNTDNRMGLFSYAAAPSFRLAEDNSSANGPGGGVGTPVLGYMMTFHVSDALAARPFNLYKRASVEEANLLSSGGHYANLNASAIIEASGGLTSGAAYTLQLEIARTDATTAMLTATYLDAMDNILASAMATDLDTPNFTFDAFLFRAGNMANKGGVHTISGFEAAVVPEPGIYASLLGMLALAYVAWRRRR
jgi:hypothetical protein